MRKNEDEEAHLIDRLTQAFSLILRELVFAADPASLWPESATCAQVLW
jgi:hypothetical protein